MEQPESAMAGGGCATCGAGAPSRTAASPFVYALGRIEARFPRLSVEKEFAQVSGRAETAGLTDRQTLQKVLSQRQNRYLARQLCWVFTIQGLDTYLITPRDPADLDLLIEAVRPDPSPLDLDLVIGVRGPVAGPEMCNGLIVPIVALDQIYSFDRAALMNSIPKPSKVSVEDFAPVAAELLDRILQMTDNAGASDTHRALNYLAIRYEAIYAKAAEALMQNASLTGVEVAPSPLSSARKIAEVIFSFRHRSTDVTEKFFVRVDVTDEFPFLVTKLSPYYDR